MNMENIYDLIIIGGGPAATAAAVYAARKRLKSLLLTESFGGQSIVSADIQNWIGEPHISGFDLAKKFEEHIRSYSDILEVKSPEKVTGIKKINCVNGTRPCDYEVTTDGKNVYHGKAVILAPGARRRKLGIPGEAELDGKGVAYCSTCDAPIFKGKKVAVVGGGNVAFDCARGHHLSTKRRDRRSAFQDPGRIDLGRVGSLPGRPTGRDLQDWFRR